MVFIIPTIVLLFLSAESLLGPLWAMLVALLFPLALEIYSLSIGRKLSFMSVFAIVGILIIGAISLLGLSREWLALRRSVVYAVVALGLIIALHFKRDFVDRSLAKVVNMDLVHAAAQQKHVEKHLIRHINKMSYAFAGFLLVIGIVSYIVTIVFITAPTGTSEFNVQYAELRVLSLLFVTLPLLVGATGILLYLVSGIEKLTGVKTEEILKKKE